MKIIKLLAFVTVTLLAMSGTSNANIDLLSSDDLVGISFWVTSMGLLAATAFFFFERRSVVSNWRTTLTKLGVVILKLKLFQNGKKSLKKRKMQ